MLKNGALIAVVLSVFVLGMSIWVGSILVNNLKAESLKASIDLIALENKSRMPDGQGDTPVQTDSIDDVETTEKPKSDDVITLDLSNTSNATTAPQDPLQEREPVVDSTKKQDSVESKTPTPPTVKASNSQNAEFWVQAGSFSTLARATAASQALQDLGLSGSIETVEHQGRILYRLRFGAWSNLAEAERFRDYLRNQQNLRNAFLERGVFDRSSDFVDAYVIQRGGA